MFIEYQRNSDGSPYNTAWEMMTETTRRKDDNHMPRHIFAACGLILGLAANACAAPPIVLDGCFDDWGDIEPVLVDPFDAPHQAVDFHAIKITHDHEYVYFKVDFGGEVTPQGLPGQVQLLLDVDGNSETGETEMHMEGVDLVLEMTRRSERREGEPGGGIGLRSTTYQPTEEETQLSPYDLDFVMAPTYATRRYEFRMERRVTLPHSPTTFSGERFRAKFVFLNWDGVLTEETDTFTYELTPTSPTRMDQPTDPLARSRIAHFRIVSWNAEHGSMIRNPDPFARVLRALKPDIILLQELTDENTASQIEAFLNEHLAGTNQHPWSVVFGRGGGSLRTAVASRHPIGRVRSLDLLPYPNQLDRHVRISGALIAINDRTLLTVSVHLKCCGRLDSREDNQRRQEVRLINKAVNQVLATHEVDGVIIGGDLNLVGAREPKRILMRDIDVDGSELNAVNAMQLSGRKNATWSERGSAFTPGRLDFLLYGDATLTPERSFVLDSTDLTPRWLEAHDILVTDTIEASDHYPVVADFRWVSDR